MMTAVDLRRLTPRDLDAIERIEHRAYPTPWSRSMFAGELAKPNGICVGAFQGEVMNIAVDVDHRGRGVARAMLRHLFEATMSDRERGYTLEVRVSNAVAIHLYESQGFVATGMRRGYYTDNREDALIMWRDHEPPADDQ